MIDKEGRVPPRQESVGSSVSRRGAKRLHRGYWDICSHCLTVVVFSYRHQAPLHMHRYSKKCEDTSRKIKEGGPHAYLHAHRAASAELQRRLKD